VVPEEQDVRADHGGYHREHVQHHGCLSSHCFVLLCPPERSKISEPSGHPRRLPGLRHLTLSASPGTRPRETLYIAK
jgi:hypothetical protein